MSKESESKATVEHRSAEEEVHRLQSLVMSYEMERAELVSVANAAKAFAQSGSHVLRMRLLEAISRLEQHQEENG